MLSGSLAASPPQTLAENLLVETVGLGLPRAGLAFRRCSLTIELVSG